MGFFCQLLGVMVLAGREKFCHQGFIAVKIADLILIHKILLGGYPIGQFFRFSVQTQVKQAQVVQQWKLGSSVRMVGKIVVF